MRIRWQI